VIAAAIISAAPTRYTIPTIHLDPLAIKMPNRYGAPTPPIRKKKTFSRYSRNDEWQTTSVNMTRVDDMDVMAAARTKGIKRLDQIKYAVLERNGAISIVKKQS
jgi:hypothetical protein